MKLSIIIPCYNEQSTIKKIVEKIYLQSDIDKEIIVVDDCSVDGTRLILETNLKDKLDNLILNTQNQGKGYSIKKGISSLHKKSDKVVLIDSDIPYFKSLKFFFKSL